MTDKTLEAVARAMFYAGDKYQGLLWDDPENSEVRRAAFREEAQAAITAARPLIMGEAAGIAMDARKVELSSFEEGWNAACHYNATAIRAAGEIK